MRRVRTLPVLLALVVLTGCTSSSEPAGPCAAERAEPPADADVQREAADLDGDGRDDDVLTFLQDGRRLTQVRLADGRAATPEPVFEGDLLAAADADDDGRAEVYGATSRAVQGASTTLTGSAFVLDGCRLVAVTAPDGPLSYVWSVGVDAKDAAAALVCLPGGVLEQTVSRPAPAPGVRRLQTRRWTLTGGTVTAPVASATTAPDVDDPALAADGTVDCG